MRFDHWIKNLFMFPGTALAIAFQYNANWNELEVNFVYTTAVAFVGLCLISSANYVINEFLDRDLDAIHPMKKHRVATSHNFTTASIRVQYFLLISVAALITINSAPPIRIYLVALLVMGIFYNVRPIRLKDRHYLDVLSESVNNPFRLAVGWHCVAPMTPVPASAFISYWGVGIFLMSLKRYTEMQIINDQRLIENYRTSFKKWTPQKLLIFSFMGALIASAFSGILLVKYHLEYILIFPALFWIFAEYLNISLNLDEASYAPEKLMRKKKLQVIALVISILYVLLSFVKIPVLYQIVYG
jgi:4-hydroxybenzoate polyprenyltransferase